MEKQSTLRKLIPECQLEKHYIPVEAVCYTDGSLPVFALVYGKQIKQFQDRRGSADLRWSVPEKPLITLVNLHPQRERVVLVSSQTEPLDNADAFYHPGYSLAKHLPALINIP